MLYAITYSDILQDLKIKQNKSTVGIIFMKPKTKLVKEKILNDIDYLHIRSSNNIDFYCAGYGPHFGDLCENVQYICTINDVQWALNMESFCNMVTDMENASKWEYSGDTELLLISYDGNKLDFSKVIVFNLEQMLTDNSIFSISNFFEKLIRYFKQNKSLIKYSNNSILNSVGDDLLEEFKIFIFNKFAKTFEKSKHYCIQDCSKGGK